MPPYKPTEDMIEGVQQGELRGRFTKSYFIPARMLKTLVDPTTATLRLNDRYEFVPEPLWNQENLKAEDKLFHRLYFIMLFAAELPSFYFWQPPGLPSPTLLTPRHAKYRAPSKSQRELGQPTLPDNQDTSSSSEPSVDIDLSELNDTSSSYSSEESEGDIVEGETPVGDGAFPSGMQPDESNDESNNETLSTSSWSSLQREPTAMSFGHVIDSKRPSGTFPLNSQGFPPKLVHGEPGAIQIRDFRNFRVWEAAISKLIGRRRDDPEDAREPQIPNNYIVNLWFTRSGKSELYCRWKMVPGRREFHEFIIATLLNIPEMARERCVLRVHRLEDNDYKIFPPPKFANGGTFCLHNPYVGYAWVQIPWSDPDSQEANSRQFISHVQWLFSKAGWKLHTQYYLEITGYSLFTFTTDDPSTAISESLQNIFAYHVANSTLPPEVRIYNPEFQPERVDSITMVRVARRQAVRSFRELNSRNFFECFKRLYRITNSSWAVRVHPNDDCWERDSWEFISPESTVAKRHAHFDTNIRPKFRQYQNVIVSMCPRTIMVHSGVPGKRNVSREWGHTWDLVNGTSRIQHSMIDFALICVNLLGIDPRTDAPGVLIKVSGWREEQEYIYWHHGMDEQEWRKEVYYKIDGSDIVVYPGDSEKKQHMSYGSFLDAVTRHDNNDPRFLPLRRISEGRELGWERFIKEIGDSDTSESSSAPLRKLKRPRKLKRTRKSNPVIEKKRKRYTDAESSTADLSDSDDLSSATSKDSELWDGPGNRAPLSSTGKRVHFS
ncbi:hypothetical protein FQN54_003734 [Arachnomyces sp. PD_36]|nr:hypothetical protein FQN54_003734 [Arachnomyces sp. PD_36]